MVIERGRSSYLRSHVVTLCLSEYEPLRRLKPSPMPTLRAYVPNPQYDGEAGEVERAAGEATGAFATHRAEISPRHSGARARGV